MGNLQKKLNRLICFYLRANRSIKTLLIGKKDFEELSKQYKRVDKVVIYPYKHKRISLVSDIVNRKRYKVIQEKSGL